MLNGAATGDAEKTTVCQSRLDNRNANLSPACRPARMHERNETLSQSQNSQTTKNNQNQGKTF